MQQFQLAVLCITNSAIFIVCVKHAYKIYKATFTEPKLLEQLMMILWCVLCTIPIINIMFVMLLEKINDNNKLEIIIIEISSGALIMGGLDKRKSNKSKFNLINPYILDVIFEQEGNHMSQLYSLEPFLPCPLKLNKNSDWNIDFHSNQVVFKADPNINIINTYNELSSSLLAQETTKEPYKSNIYPFNQNTRH